MKKITILLLIFILISGISCKEDFLNRYPYDKKVVGNFYQTPTDAFEALVAVYDGLQYTPNNPDFTHVIQMTEISSDNCFGGAGTGDDLNLQVFDNFIQGLVELNGVQWEKSYRGIYKANVFLQEVENIDWGSQVSLKNRYIGEARFLRAYQYFDLVRIFGNIPLVDKVLVENFDIPQADPADVYKFIAEDLLFAIENCSDSPYESIPLAEYGRVTKWAAEALLARAFLFYTGYYNKPDLAGVVTKDQVRGYIRDIIDNGHFGLVENFEHLWHYSRDNFVGEDNIETVFAIKYTYKALADPETYDGARWQIMVGLRVRPVPPYGTGWGAATVNQKLWDEWNDDDTRKVGTIVDLRNHFWITSNGDTVKRAMDFDGDGVYTDSIYWQNDSTTTREYTGYNWRKFCPLTLSNDSSINLTESMGANFSLDNFFDWAVIRYSDVLLMAAELYLDSDIGFAQSCFDQVRYRAFNDHNHYSTLTNDDAGKDLILEERRWEFALEGHRYWDLLRHDGLAGNLATAKQEIDNNEPEPFDVEFRTETEGLYRIPQRQITLSEGLLKQNPGWD
ncbi:RagB/SusD family nutrient uptake outer membrane protein [Bacteroidota bacterium]